MPNEALTVDEAVEIARRHGLGLRDAESLLSLSNGSRSTAERLAGHMSDPEPAKSSSPLEVELRRKLRMTE